MTYPSDPTERQPKGDHNRRLSLGLDPEHFASAAGISVEELREYESTSPDHQFSPMIAQRVGESLERLETVLPNSEAAGIQQILAGDEAVPTDGVFSADPTIEQSIRDTAYYLWEKDGRPEGRDDEYWHRARDAWVGQKTLDTDFQDDIAEPDPELADRALEASRRIGLQRPFKEDPEDNTSGGFNQKR